MFSYRHAFHAGNHADVLKHAMFVHILEYFGRKPAPYWVIDTHAGAGLYGLQGDWSTKTAESAEGVGRLWGSPDAPPLVDRYLQALADFNPAGALKAYPGSPWWALQYMREADRLRLFEWHPTESEVLAGNLAHLERAVQRRIMLYHADGFKGLNALLPPPTRQSRPCVACAGSGSTACFSAPRRPHREEHRTRGPELTRTAGEARHLPIACRRESVATSGRSHGRVGRLGSRHQRCH